MRKRGISRLPAVAHDIIRRFESLKRTRVDPVKMDALRFVVSAVEPSGPSIVAVNVSQHVTPKSVCCPRITPGFPAHDADGNRLLMNVQSGTAWVNNFHGSAPYRCALSGGGAEKEAVCLTCWPKWPQQS